MDKCEKCGFLECRCPDHVAQNYVPKADIRKLRDECREKSDGMTYYDPSEFADWIDKLLENE